MREVRAGDGPSPRAPREGSSHTPPNPIFSLPQGPPASRERTAHGPRSAACTVEPRPPTGSSAGPLGCCSGRAAAVLPQRPILKQPGCPSPAIPFRALAARSTKAPACKGWAGSPVPAARGGQHLRLRVRVSCFQCTRAGPISTPRRGGPIWPSPCDRRRRARPGRPNSTGPDDPAGRVRVGNLKVRSRVG